MPGPDIATKAPENDAAEESAAGGSEAQLCDDCVTDRPTPSGQASTGEIIKLSGIDTYISKPSDYPHVPARLLLLLTGGTGVKSTNNQIQSDKFATEGFLVVMPDLFAGDPAPNQKTTEEDDIPLIEKVKMRVADTAKSFLIDMWLARHTEAKILPTLHKVIEGCRNQFQDAVENGMYGVGYCFGGRYILHLASERIIPSSWEQTHKEQDATKQMKGPIIKAGALAHATLVTPEDFQGLKAPVSFVCVENDALFPDETRKAGEDYLSKNNIEHEVQIYPGVPHGFAVVGEYDDSSIKQAQETAFDQMLTWIDDH